MDAHSRGGVGVISAAAIKKRLGALGSREDAEVLQWFFKTGPGEYGEGDVFAGVRVPVLRKLTGEFAGADESTLHALLESGVHEERLLALLILVRQFEKGSEAGRRRIHTFYLAHTHRINNWDLVDLSAPRVVGGYLVNRPRRLLYRLVKSKSLWERRISVLATFAFIRQGDFADSLALAERLLGDREDLIHKAVGWMLREVGKRDLAVLETFLQPRCKTMPRTMLRYAIEKFPEPLRLAYLRAS